MANDKDRVVITNPLTGKALKKAPDGTSLEGVSFENREEAKAFIAAHWPEHPVEMVSVPAK